MKGIQKIKNHAFDLIQEQKVKEAIDFLLEKVSRTHPLFSQLLLISARFNRLSQNQKLGTLKNEDINIESNRVLHALTELIKNLDSSSVSSQAKKMEKDFSVDNVVEEKKEPIPWVLYFIQFLILFLIIYLTLYLEAKPMWQLFR